MRVSTPTLRKIKVYKQCYPRKWKLFVHETYCENISFLSEANKRKVYHEIPPEPDLGVVLKEENEEEDKDKPKVSTF